jgi:tRNA modification GTPase
MAEADVLLLVLDATTSLHPEDEAIMAASSTRPFLVAINKCDLAPTTFTHQITEATVETSALTGAGIPELRRAILTLITTNAPASETALLTNLRQQQAVTTALTALAQAQRAVAATIPHEMILLDLYAALHALDALTGTTTTDDIIHLIFSKFCIGK